ncbi:hypothetical protein ACJ72_06953 [Emergomyces africanus]|uniref:Protein kinase domain-containing protein n=1 Tax=Emergomyces africanus TaxID=1955775 RepID=A0A1B7NQ35_9EURO|nr:hypothetical protein ACJ72_06953 [Emergomyces africanus]
MKKAERHLEFEGFVSLIDFDSLPPLLDDTVTEIELIPVTKPVFTVHEDSLRVIYPHVGDLSVPTRQVSDVRSKEEIRNVVSWVSRIQLKDDERWYIYEEIDRPFYSPRDSVVLQQEVQNLRLLRDWDYNISVMRGILLDYHSAGILERILKKTNRSNHLWQKWALQITEALNQIHLSNNTHIDLKLSNVVIDNEDNAVLIDIKWYRRGHAGMVGSRNTRYVGSSHLKCAREMISGLRVNLSAMVGGISNNGEKKLIKSVAAAATTKDPKLRVGLPCIFSKKLNVSKGE